MINVWRHHGVMTAWRKWTQPSEALVEPEDQRRARLLLSILLPLSGLAFAGALAAYFFSRGSGLAASAPALVALIAGAGMTAAFVLGRTRHYEHAAVMAVGIAIVGTWQAYFASHGQPSDEYILFFLAISLVMSALFLPPYYTATIAVMHVVGLAALVLLYDPAAQDMAITAGVFLVVMGVLVAVSDGLRRTDLQRRIEAETARRSSETRFRVAFDAAAVGRGVATPDGHWTEVNDALCRVLGYSRDEMLAPHAPTLTLEEDRPQVQAAWRAMLSGEVPTLDLETRFLHKQGHVVWVRVVASVVRAADGRPVYVVSDVQDITERRQIDEARLLALERLSEISRLKDVNSFKTQLLNTASHELNTPIAALRMQLHLLRKARFADPALEKSVAILDRNVQRLATLVKDILDVARLESGQLKLRRERVDLGAVVSDAVEAYAEAAREAGVNLRVRAEDGLWLEADAQRVTQVVHNLLSNALKFTPPDGTVEVDASRHEDGGLVRIRDSGAGLSGEQMAKLFQPFSQVHDTMQQTRAGTGLGLHICKGIVEQHGGRIWVESEGPGRGSAFSFTLSSVTVVPLVSEASPA